MSSSEIFTSLDYIERGFKDVINGESGDFIISWNDISIDSLHQNDSKVLAHAPGSSISVLNGSLSLNTSSPGVIIPGGYVNFSKACRENETLGNVKSKLNIILSGLLAIGLFKYLYNLVLSTLGIDNPYLYEGSKETNTDVEVTAKKRKLFYDKNGNVVGWGRSDKK